MDTIFSNELKHVLDQSRTEAIRHNKIGRASCRERV